MGYLRDVEPPRAALAAGTLRAEQSRSHDRTSETRSPLYFFTSFCLTRSPTLSFASPVLPSLLVSLSRAPSLPPEPLDPYSVTLRFPSLPRCARDRRSFVRSSDGAQRRGVPESLGSLSSYRTDRPLDRPAVVSPPLTARGLRSVEKRDETYGIRPDVFLPLFLSLSFFLLLSLSLTDPSRHTRFPLFFSRLAARSLTHLSVFGWPCPFAHARRTWRIPRACARKSARASRLLEFDVRRAPGTRQRVRLALPRFLSLSFPIKLQN